MAPYMKLLTYWYALVIYDRTVEFCNLYIKSYKLREQMTGAGRSGKQNIVEGSEGLRTSVKTAIRLTDVSKGSLEELTGDYEDFLRQGGFETWGKNHPTVIKMRAWNGKVMKALIGLVSIKENSHRQQKERNLLMLLRLPKDPEVAANWLLTLCHQATSLLEKQVTGLEKKHMEEGGYSERLYLRRINYRKGLNRS